MTPKGILPLKFSVKTSQVGCQQDPPAGATGALNKVETMPVLVSLDKGPLQKIYISSYCYLNQDRFLSLWFDPWNKKHISGRYSLCRYSLPGPELLPTGSIQLTSMAFNLFPNRGDGNLPAICQAIRLLWKTWLWVFTDALHRPLWKERLHLWLRVWLGWEAYCKYLLSPLLPSDQHCLTPCQTFCLHLWGKSSPL